MSRTTSLTTRFGTLGLAALAVLLLALVGSTAMPGRASSPMSSALEVGESDWQRADDAVPHVATAQLRANGVDFSHSKTVAEGLPGYHSIATVKTGSLMDRPSRPGESLCIAGKLESDAVTTTSYATCQEWETIEQEGLTYHASGPDGFVTIIFVPGVTQAQMPQSAKRDTAMQLAVEDGLVLIEGKAQVDGHIPSGQVQIDRQAGAPLMVDVGAPGSEHE